MKKVNIGELLKTHRSKLGLSQRSLANELGIEASHLAYIEKGQRKPSFKLVGRIADTLGIDRQAILVLTHPETRELLTTTNSASGGKTSPSWERFTKARELLAWYHVTNRELQALKHLSFLGTELSVKDFLTILTLIRDIPKNK